jgi:hypothetical protein
MVVEDQSICLVRLKEQAGSLEVSLESWQVTVTLMMLVNACYLHVSLQMFLVDFPVKAHVLRALFLPPGLFAHETHFQMAPVAKLAPLEVLLQFC